MDFGDKNMSDIENVELKREDDDHKGRKLGGIKTMPFILANEICDRFAATGFHANMITYLTTELNLPMVKASNTLTNFGGLSSFTPLIGALIADSFAGRYRTIVVGSIIYVMGMICVILSATLPSLRPPKCPTQKNCQEASTQQLWVLYISLLLTSLGVGGIRPCVVTFAADQLKTTIASKGGYNFFNWYYFCMGFATLIALTVVVYIQDNVGWGLGLGIPTIAMGLSVIVFVLGSPRYLKLKPGGSPLVRVFQVIVAAVKKRKEVLPEDPAKLYENRELDSVISVKGRLLHTNQFKSLDKAAVVKDDEITDSGRPNLWRLATTHRVEELKSLIRILPIWATGILLIMANSHNNTFVIQQAGTMDRHLTKSFQIPSASLSIFSVLTTLVGLALYDRLFVPFIRRFTGNPSGITYLQRMGIGFFVNTISTMVSALVEKRRKAVAARYGLLDDPEAIIPISVFWLIPQFCLHGIADVFMSAAHLEFLYDQSPESMRSCAAALFWISISIGNYCGTFLVSIIHKYTGNTNNWLPDTNLNRGKLDYYYWVISGIQALNLVYYIICASFYTYKPLEQAIEDGGEQNLKEKQLNGDVELIENEAA